MRRAAELDRRKNGAALRRQQSSSYSSNETLSSEEVPIIDIYNGSSTKKMRNHQSTLSTIWRTFSSLVPFSREGNGGSSSSSRSMPRYDLRDSESDILDLVDVAAEEDDCFADANDLQELISLSPLQCHEQDLGSDSSCSLERDAMENGLSAARELKEFDEVLLIEEGDPNSNNNKKKALGILRRKPRLKEVDVDAYMAKREMSELQEKWNAITMIPAPAYCLHFLWACTWVPALLVEEMKRDVQQSSGTVWPETWIGEVEDCQSWGRVGLPGVPPLPVLAIVTGIVLHTPWSMLYHWRYAHRYSATERVKHWSRRMDHAMMHFGSALFAYATSGSYQYMLAAGLFNADSAYRQFEHRVSPRRNKVRMTLAFIAYTIPILRQGHVDLFLQFYAAFALSAWLFATYPIGGWSHAAFHITMLFTLYPLLQSASLTGAAQESVQIGAQCMAWNQQ